MHQSAAQRALMGPNAIIQTFAALGESLGPARILALTSGTALERYVGAPPTELIDECEFHALARGLCGQLGPEMTAQILARAGALTAEYVIANRIPPFARLVLRRLPTRLALHLLLPAIARFSWTFAGSGTFRFGAGRPAWLSITSPLLQADRGLATVVCPYYRAAFDRLLCALIGSPVALCELSCLARGADVCAYQIELRG